MIFSSCRYWPGALAVSLLAACAGPQSRTPDPAPPLAVTVAPPPAAPVAPSALPWDQAKNHVGETLTVTGPVVGTHLISEGDRLVLNVGKDFPDRSRFCVYLTPENTSPLSEDAYMGKTIRVTGTIVLYQNVPEIKATPKDVAIEK